MKRVVTTLIVMLLLIGMAMALTAQDVKNAHDNRGNLCPREQGEMAVKLTSMVSQSWIKANPGTGDITKCYTTNKGRKVKVLSSMSSEQGARGQWRFTFNMPRPSKLNTFDDFLLVGYLGYMDKRPYKAWLVPDSVLSQHEAVEGTGIMHDHKNHNYLSVSILNPPAWLSPYEYKF